MVPPCDLGTSMEIHHKNAWKRCQQEKLSHRFRGGWKKRGGSKTARNEIRHGDDQDFLLQRERELPLVHVCVFLTPIFVAMKNLHIFIYQYV